MLLLPILTTGATPRQEHWLGAVAAIIRDPWKQFIGRKTITIDKYLLYFFFFLYLTLTA